MTKRRVIEQRQMYLQFLLGVNNDLDDDLLKDSL